MSDQDATPKKKKFNTKGLWWKIPLMAISLLVFINALGGGSGGLPECQSNRAKNTLTKAFDSSQFARSLNLSVVDITESTERGGSTKKQMLCRANIVMNNGNAASVHFQMDLRDDGQFLLSFQVQE